MRGRGLASLLALGALGALGASTASASETVPGEVRLDSAADVALLCRELASGPAAPGEGIEVAASAAEAAAAVYVVSVAADGFAFAPYDAIRGRLVVETLRPLRLPGGAAELAFYGLAGEPAPGAGPLEIAVPATAEEATRLARARRTGGLALTIWFRTAAPHGGRPPCAIVHAREGRGTRLAIRPLAFRLASGGARVAEGELAEFTALRVDEAAAGSPPRVVLAAPVLTSTRGPAPEAVVRAVAAVGPALQACAGVGAGARGTIVVGLVVAGDGRVVEARPELDGLGVPAVASCLVTRLRAARFPAALGRVSLPVRFE